VYVSQLFSAVFPVLAIPMADTDHVGFYINLPIGGVVAVLLFFLRIPEADSKPPARQVLGTAIKSLDLPGFVLISPAAVMFLLGLQYGGNQYAWNSSVVIGLLVGAGVMFALFLVWEHKQGDEAMVPFAMLTHRIIWSAAGNTFFLLSSILVADFYLAIYFQAIHNDSPLMSGVHMLPTTIGMVLFTMTSGVMSTYRPLATPCVCERAAQLTASAPPSRNVGLLPPMGCRREYHIGHWLRTLIAPESFDPSRKMDRVPGLLWGWQRRNGLKCKLRP
jgi:hypothetical protein